MRIGLALSELNPAAIPADARSAEAQGFDLVASGEHLFFHGPIPNAFAALAAASAVTHTVRLLSSLTILPLYAAAVTARGEFGVLDGLSLNPPSVQRPHPPIWVGGRKQAAMSRAGRFADVFMPYVMSPDNFRDALRTSRTYAEQAG